MALATKSIKPVPSWQRALQEAVTNPAELLELLELPLTLLEGALTASSSFKLRVPRGFVANMEKKNPKDPLLLQVLPLVEETKSYSGFEWDPLQEAHGNPTPGLLHKYPGRVLLTATGACAVHCRYCFRRHFPYQENNPSPGHWQLALDYIQQDTSIKEVILSGGDPLLLKDEHLLDFVQRLENMEHVTTLRFHTRTPIVLPERITPELVTLLQQTRLKTVMVMHCNHPAECDDRVAMAMAALKKAPITLLNQSVLLKGVNDDSFVLAQLSKRLFEIGILPYYLHLLDKVHGSGHFEVKEEDAKILMATLSTQLPGYLVPKLAREIPGQKSKHLIHY